MQKGNFFELRRTQSCRDDNSVRGAAIPYVHPEALAMPELNVENTATHLRAEAEYAYIVALR